MKLHKAVVVIGSVLLLAAVMAGSYMVRWLAVLFLGVFLAFFLFGVEIKVSIPVPELRANVERKTDVDRTVTLIQEAKTGKVARSLLGEKIIDIYATISDDYNSTLHSLRSEPNEALRVLNSEGDFLDNLEKALNIVEADLNED
ncbi:hypothetical protein A3L11_02780 [Thermococcus siculi]|uniref:Uncharacterized protein n=1 Tax=Thermococcus siculi TaxID=72803 RepID=A0A2Z2MK76_9EURY|nr:hypothetical protein [Thermococcus siculi]ASJ08208.1 hypothetical protein A3L11_02780 [Thermococcus siculi]